MVKVVTQVRIRPKAQTKPNQTMKTTKDKFMNTKGGYISVGFQSSKKPAAANKHHKLVKVTVGVFRAGIDYAKLATVNKAIADKERGEVQGLPWGEWESFPYTITNKGNRYFRLYTSKNPDHKIRTAYFVDGRQVPKANFALYLTPAAARDLLAPSRELDCFTVKESGMFFADSAPTQGAKEALEAVAV